MPILLPSFALTNLPTQIHMAKRTSAEILSEARITKRHRFRELDSAESLYINVWPPITLRPEPERNTTFVKSLSTPSRSISGTQMQEGRTPSTIRILSWNVGTPVPFLNLLKNRTGSSPYEPRPRHLRKLLEKQGFPDFVCFQGIRKTRIGSLL